MSIEELIGKLEQATGPDRELDGEIAKQIGWTFTRVRPHDRTEYWREPGVDPKERWFMRRELPNFTSSIDAIISLARNDAEHFDMLKDYVTHGRDTGSKTKGLCRAIANNLRARTSMESKHE